MFHKSLDSGSTPKDNYDSRSKDNSDLRSKDGKKCLTRCYEKGHSYIHPVLLKPYVDTSTDTCGIYPETSLRTNDARGVEVGECELDSNDKYKYGTELDTVLLRYRFNPSDFLRSVYGVTSFDEALKWIEKNPMYPQPTKNRIENCAWRVYGDKIENISEHVLHYYYKNVYTAWIPKISLILFHKYGNKISNKLNIDHDKLSPDSLGKYITDEVLPYSIYVQVLKEYIHSNRSQWRNIDYHLRNFRKFLLHTIIEYLKLN